MRANGADVSVAEAAHVFAANATDVASAVKASNVTSTAKTAAHMATATEAAAKSSAVTATTATAGVGCACQQARGEKSCCHYRDHPFHRDTPFQSDCSAL
jgi:hypothetical protein